MRSIVPGSLRPLCRKLNHLAALSLFALLGTTSAYAAPGDCVLQIAETSPIAADAGMTPAFTITAVEGGNGATSCTAADYSITETADTTAGSDYTPATPSGTLSVGTSTNRTITLPAPPNGGGTVTYTVSCTNGCGDTAFTDPTFTVNVNDHFSLSRIAPGQSPELFVRTDTTPQTLTYTVQLLKNGLSSGTVMTERPICFTFTNNPNGASFATAGSGCGAGGTEVIADAMGVASIDLDIPLQNPVEDTIDVTALATGVSSMPSDLFELEAVDTVIVTIVSGDNQTAPINNPFPLPFVVDVTSNGVPDIIRQVDWSFNGSSGGSLFNPPGSTTTSTSPDANGRHQVSVVGGTTPAGFDVRGSAACCGGDATEFFSATTTGGLVVQLKPVPPSIPAGSPFVLEVDVFNGGIAVPDGTTVTWTFDTAVNGTLNGAGSANTTTSSGTSTVTFQPNATGPFPIRATVDLGGGTTDDDAVTVNAVDDYAFVHDVPSDGMAAGFTDTDINLSVILSKNGTPVDGETVNYFVMSGPAGRMVQFTPQNPTTTGGGRAQTLFKGDTAGQYMIRAEAVSDLSKTIDITVDLTTPVLRTLTKPALSGDNASERPGQQVILSVDAEDNGSPPESATTINWSIVSGGGPSGISLNSPTSNTGPGGRATNVVTFGSATGPSRVRAERADDPTVYVEFDLETFVFELDILTPPGGTGPAVVGQPTTLGIQLRKRGTTTGPLATRTIHWGNPGTTGTFTPGTATSDTDAGGNATIEFTPNARGDHSITAEFRDGGPSPLISVPFTLHASSLEMRAHASPSPIYTDEATVSGVAVQTTRDDGTVDAADPGVAVQFFIMTPASATFVGGATSALVNSDSGGIATSPAIVVGHDLTTVVVQANSTGRTGVTTNLPVTASAYFISTSTPNQTVSVGGNATPQVLVERQGSGARVPLSGAVVAWSATPAGGSLSPSSTTAASGIATNTFTPSTAGTYTVTGTYDPQLAGVSPVSQDTIVTANAVSKTLEVVSGTGQSAPPGSALASPLVIVAKDNAVFAPGVTVNWTVSPAGAGTVTPSSGTTSAADGTMSVNATIDAGATPGSTVTFTATRADDPGATVSFAATVMAVSKTLEVVSGTGQSAPPGSALASPLVVVAKNDAVFAPGVTVNWTVSPAGAGTVTPPSGTTSAGDGTMSVNATIDAGATPGSTVTFTATRADEPGATASFAATVMTVSKTLHVVSGDGQSGAPGDTLPSKLVVVSRNNAVFAPGVTVNWTVSPAGAATVTPSSGTTASADGTLAVDATLSGSAAPGTTVTFTATRADEPAATVNFTAAVTAPVVRSLRKPVAGSGDGQGGVIGTTLTSPLIVIAEDSGAAASGVVVNWTASGDAIVDPSSTTTGADGSTQVLVTLGTAPGNYVITATRSDAPSATSAFVVSATAPPTELLSIVEGDRQSGLAQRRSEPLAVRYTRNGVPVGDVTVTWSIVSGSATLDETSGVTGADGVARTALTFGNAAGPILVRARADSAFAEFHLDVTRATLGAASGNGQVGVPEQPLAADFVVRLDTSPPATTSLEGLDVRWEVVEGGGSVTPATSVTDANGEARARYTLGPAPGPYVVRATLPDGSSALFEARATDTPDGTFFLRPVSGNAQQGLVGTHADQPLIVEVTDNQGNKVPNRNINWSVVSGGATLDARASLTDQNGRARVGFAFGTAGPIVLRADCGCSPPVSFTATALSPGVTATSGDDQVALINTELAQDLVVRVAPAQGKTLEGIVVRWEVLSGGGSFAAPTSTSDAQGEARNRWRLGPQAGTQTARAVLPGGQTVAFSATALGSAIVLRIVSGDDQTLATNDPSAPMVVELTDSSGTPLSGIVLRWTGTDSVTLDQPTTTTSSAGRTQNVARLTQAGPAMVRVRARDIDSNELVFDLNAGVSNIPGLDPTLDDTSGAIDALCPALGALTTRTPEQEDLYRRCLELINNAGNDPDAVENALDELPTDVGQTLSESALDSVDTQLENLATRFNTLHGAQGGGLPNTFNVGLWTLDGTLPLGFLPAALDGDEAAGDATEAGAEFDRWGFFATGIIGRGEAKAGQRTPEFDYDISGLTAGVDYRVNDRLVVGGALGLTRNDTDLARSQGTLETSGWSLSAYASWFSTQQWYVDSSLTYGSNDYDLTRRINYRIRAADNSITEVDQRADASTSGDTLGLTLAVGRDWQKGAWNLGGYLRGDYSRAEFDAYEESLIAGLPGQGLALAVDARTVTSMSSVVGGRATYVLSRDWGVLMPNASIEWEHEFEDDPNQVSARFLFDPTNTRIEQFGAAVDTDTFNVGVGVSALFPGGRSAYVYYEQLVGAARLRQGILSIGVRIEF